MHGFFKTSYTNTLEYLSVKNNVSQFCKTNELIFNIESSNECNDYSKNLCDPNILLFDLRYILNGSNVVHTNYPLELIDNEGDIVRVNDINTCFEYVGKGFKYKSIYTNEIKIPWINLIYLIASLLSLLKVNKIFRNKIDTKSLNIEY